MKHIDEMCAWSDGSENAKTGNVLQCAIGRTRSECRATCISARCPLLDNGCYAHRGKVSMARGSMFKAKEKRTLARALSRRKPDVRYARVGMIGDPYGCVREIRSAAARVRAEGLGVLGYTHAWRQSDAKPLQSCCLASCDSPDDTHHAIKLGWIPAAIVPADTKGSSVRVDDGHLVVCPAQRSDRVTCTDCGLCDPQSASWTRDHRYVGIAFRKH